MRKVVVIVAPILIAYLLLTFFTGNLLGLQGVKLWILRGALWLIGSVAAAVVVWFFWDKAKREKGAAGAAAEAPAGGEDVPLLIRDAEKKLAASQLAKGARIGNLPLVLVLGEASSSKTSTMVHSGLEPEVLAGQIYQDGNITSTRSAILWYSHQTIFVEAGGKLLEDSQGRASLAKHLQPRQLKAVVGASGQAPRAALVCVEIERITARGQVMTATARNLRAALGEIAQTFGIQLPVYVLITKTDRLSFFADFVRNLSNEEAAQPLGATLPIPGPVSGVWAEEQTALLGGVFDRIFRALADARPELLARENDAGKLPGAYEFPREFKKLRASLVQFLVEVCRPSQLTVGPFLRGFYFSGVRPVIVQEAAQAPAPQAAQDKADAREATAMFRVPAGGQAASAAPRRAAVSRKVAQWVFLTHFFNHVLLADRAAMGASGSSSKTDLRRRILLIAAAALCLIVSIGFTVSFVLNRGLEGRVREALQGTAAIPSAAGLAPVETLRHLEALRQSLNTLTVYNREGAPLSYRWGLFVGNELYPDVRRLYFTRFKAVLFGQTQNSLAAFLGGLPAAPAPPATPGYDQAYDALKAYLITTSNPDKSTREFLSPVLLRTWSANAGVDPERLQLAQKQFDFYSDELKVENPFTKQNDQTAVLRAQSYLRQFGALDRIYQTMKSGAPKTTVNFNRQIAGSRNYVVDNFDVAGPFTKDGWKFMSDAIQNPGRYVHGEKWVLGDEGKVNTDPRELIKPLLSRYQTDYVDAWRTYLKSANVVKYKDFKDAAEKLSMLSGNQSPLLALFALASQNIPWDDPEVAKALQPVQYLEPPPADVRYIGPQNKDYADALGKLQTDVEAVANAPADTTATSKAQADAGDAKNTANQAARNFTPGSDPDGVVQKLLLAPITEVEGKLRGLGPGELNAGGKALCGQFHAVLNKYPFNPASKQDATVEEVNSILKKPDGALWKFYEDSLKKFLTKQGNQYVPAAGGNITINQRFAEFFTQAASFSDFLYAGGDPRFSYTLKPVPTDTVQRIGLDIDGQKLDYTGGTPAAKQFTWQPGGTHGAKGTYGADGVTFEVQDGIWAIFRMFGDADKSPASGGGGEFDWIIRQGKAGAPSMVNGKPVTVRLQLDMGGALPIFQKGFFSRLACVSEVAKP
ncbi:MAG: ImcF-related family protein [Bryobacteraceae bacterium]